MLIETALTYLHYINNVVSDILTIPDLSMLINQPDEDLLKPE